MKSELDLPIDRIKYKLVQFYVVLLSIEIFFYVYMNYFFGNNIVFISILLIFLILVLYTYFLTRTTNKAKLVIHMFLIYASLLVSFIAINLLSDSLVCVFWMMPLPYAAYILFGKKQSVFYTFYLMILTIIVLIIRSFVNLQIVQIPLNILWISDGFVWFFNLITFGLLIHFDARIQQVKEDYFNENRIMEPKISESLSANNDKWEAIFKQVRDIVENNFRDPHLSVGKITEKLNSNHVYISNAIKASGFDNFNDYINSVRIRHIKTLLTEGALKTTTLFYIYNEAGFINHSTFNRAFKKVEGITPSEYVKRLNWKTLVGKVNDIIKP